MANFHIATGTGDDFDDGRRKARRFFAHGKSCAENGQFEYAIEMILQGLHLDPENLNEHLTLRRIARKRWENTGRSMGAFDLRKYPTNTKDQKQNMLNVERQLAFDPSNNKLMHIFHDCAGRAGYRTIADWLANVLIKAANNPDKTSED